MKKNAGSQVIGAQLIAKADGTPVTTGTTTVYVTGDGGTQAAGSVGSGACTHEGQGFWTYAPAQAETNYDHVAFTFVNTNAINATIQVYPSYPQTGDSYARLGAPAGASVSADVAAIKAETASILTDTAEIGAAGAGLTALATQASVNTIDDFLDTEIAAILAYTGELQTDWANGGRLDLMIDAIKAKTDNLPAAPAATGDIPSAASIADAVWDEALAGHVAAGSAGEAAGKLDAAVSTRASQTSLDTLDDYVDAEVAAIKAKTDSLTFTVAGQVDANIQSVNDVTVTGDGQPGTEWGP